MPKQANRDGVFQRPDAPGWYASYVDSNGKRLKCRVQGATRTQAIVALDALKVKAQQERILGVKHTSDISTADLFKRFVKHQKPRIAATTFARLGDILETLKARLPAKLKDIGKAEVAEYINARSGEVAPGTVQKEIATLKHALRLAVEWELIHRNPAERATLPKLPEGRTKYLSPTELKALLEKAPEWMRPPIALAAFTGMRRGEILGLHWRDVDIEGRRVYLHETKNGSLRVLPLNDLATRVLHSLPSGAPADKVLPDVDGHRLTVYTRRLFAALKIEGASFHTLRHTAASWLAMSGADLYAVGQFLGHKTPRMTQRYAHLSPSYMAETAGKLDLAFGKALSDGTPTGLTTVQTDTNVSEGNRSGEGSKAA